MTAKPKHKRAISPFARGHVATARDPILGGIEARSILDITNLQAEMIKALNRIKSRDGTRVFRNRARWLRDTLDTMIAT
jgi:hypothetical protein